MNEACLVILALKMRTRPSSPHDRLAQSSLWISFDMVHLRQGTSIPAGIEFLMPSEGTRAHNI